jgi:hypothetical protein
LETTYRASNKPRESHTYPDLSYGRRGGEEDKSIPTHPKPRKRTVTTATQQLHLKLVSLAKQKLYPNCATDSHLWLSDFEAERAEAVRRCGGCVVLLECDAAADEHGEKYYVFGGRDRTRKPKLVRRV